MKIEIEGLTKPQELALEDLFRTWMNLGNLGCSRWTSFYADGDGNFRPKITVNGRKPELCRFIPNEEKWKTIYFKKGKDFIPESQIYFIDFDTIAWRLREESQ